MSTISHMKKISQEQRALKALHKNNIMSAKDLGARGIHSETLGRLARSGQLERVSRGLYRIAGNGVAEHGAFAVVSAAAPTAVICLLSALAYHGVGTQLPPRVWVALDRRTRKPALEYPPLEVVRFGGTALTQGVEKHEIEGRSVRVYSVAKTVADCFKYRNKIGLDVAIEALTEAWRARRITMDEALRYARVCRVARVMTPYLRSLGE